MHIILLSGGSGSRLWPLSNETRSKQFLKLLRSANGERYSMLQRIYKQIQKNCPLCDITIATSESQSNAIENQIGERISIVIEPERRDTFPAIALTCSHLYDHRIVSPDETAIVVPIDPFTDDAYFKSFCFLDEGVQNGAADILLMGTIPVYPSEKYGYILPGQPPKGGLPIPIVDFYEKPDILRAEKLIDQGALWNCGVFAFRFQFLRDFLVNKLGYADYETIRENYSQLPKTSFDYAVVEQTAQRAVILHTGIWKDLGTWNTLTEEMPETILGNAIVGENSENTHVINELEIPILALGAKNIVIAASPDGILVSDKEKSSYMKSYVEQLQQQPRYAERKWGEYKTLNYIAESGKKKSMVRKVHVHTNKSMNYHVHQHREEIWIILDGIGEVLLGNTQKSFQAGDIFRIPKATWHSLKASTDVTFIEIQMGEELTERDTQSKPHP